MNPVENNNPHDEQCVKVPEEIWWRLFALHAEGWGWSYTSVRLLDGRVIDNLCISNRGYILGTEAPGPAGAHGSLDKTVLTFSTPDIEGVLMRRRRLFFGRQSLWVCLNPQHPARRQHNAP
jgi:hypothetical protein